MSLSSLGHVSDTSLSTLEAPIFRWFHHIMADRILPNQPLNTKMKLSFLQGESSDRFSVYLCELEFRKCVLEGAAVNDKDEMLLHVKETCF